MYIQTNGTSNGNTRGAVSAGDGIDVIELYEGTDDLEEAFQYTVGIYTIVPEGAFQQSGRYLKVNGPFTSSIYTWDSVMADVDSSGSVRTVLNRIYSVLKRPFKFYVSAGSTIYGYRPHVSRILPNHKPGRYDGSSVTYPEIFINDGYYANIYVSIVEVE